MRRAAFWALAGTTLAVYAAMIFWSIPRIVEAAGGLPTFDMRPGGYGLDEARAFLAALSPDGAAFYGDVQLSLDTIYPGLMAATLGIGLFWLWRGLSLWLGGGLAALALAAGAADYVENAGIRRMLAAGADGLTAEMVATASGASQAKAGLTTVAMIALVAGLVRHFWRRSRRTG